MKLDSKELGTAADATTRYLSLEHFGASGPYARLADEFGFTPANCLRLARCPYSPLGCGEAEWALWQSGVAIKRDPYGSRIILKGLIREWRLLRQL